MKILTQNASMRRALSLNGDWGYIVDPYETGARHQRNWQLFEGEFRADDRTFYEDRQPTGAGDRVEYDFRGGPKLRVPGDWGHQVESLLYYEGMVWYHRCFDYKLAPGRRLFARFEAANYLTAVYLNGEALGLHEGGFDPFEFEITEHLREGENSLVARVSNRRELHGVPGMTTDWWNYGGITREVFLYETPETFVRDYYFQLDTGSDGRRASFEARLDGSELRSRVAVSIPELGFHREVEADESGLARATFDLPALERWSPSSPKLYDVELACGLDRVFDRIGFRTIEVVGPEILLNGEAIFLRGISAHEEVPSVPRRACSREDGEEIFALARELNCNFVRLAHYPHGEYMPRLADELGFLLWEEIPVYWGIDYENPATLRVAEGQLRGLVQRDRNRASVAIWSLANETPVTESRLAFLRQLKRVARELDPVRLVSAALDRSEADEGRCFRLDDPFAREVDVMSCNQYLGWYYGNPGNLERVRWEIDADKPFFASEFGAGAKAGLRGPKGRVWTEDHQAWIVREQLAMLRKVSNFRGCSPWILRDFRSPRRNLAGVQDHWNRKGMVSDGGEKKLAFYELKRFYEEIEKEWKIRGGKD